MTMKPSRSAHACLAVTQALKPVSLMAPINIVQIVPSCALFYLLLKAVPLQAEGLLSTLLFFVNFLPNLRRPNAQHVRLL